MQKQLDMAMILITHDLGIVAETVDNVAVMYAGKIVEYTDTESIFREPMHPYTVGLLNSMPAMEGAGKGHLSTIPGAVPVLLNLPKGCTFYDRCPKADTICTEHEPELVEVKKGHWAACYKVS